ncbi:MAG: hypothetical protein F8N38_22290 [Hungatella sp.]|nr:hypothetical protein [Hungatella sp.]
MDFISEQKFRISGFSKEITMIDYGITDDTKKFVTEIQIPIYHGEAQIHAYGTGGTQIPSF